MSFAKNVENNLWVAKYAPKNLKDLILEKNIKEKFEYYIKTKEIPNIGLFGPQGTGKTSTGKVLLNELNVDKSDVLFLNASDINNVDSVRDIIKPFAMSMSSNSELPLRFIFLDECLSENEKVRVGTIDDWKAIPLKELKPNMDYPIVSFNMETGEIENDIGNIISDKEDEIYEVELEDGRCIELNAKHPFLVKNEKEKIVEKTILDGLSVGDDIVVLDNNKMKIKRITKKGKGRVLNLTVQKNHTFITENGIPTHNCDYLTPNAQAVLRNLIESSYKSARFILTANYPKKIIPALHSRIQIFQLERPNLDQIADRIIKIIENEKIELNSTNDGTEDLIKLIKDTFPDVRKTIQTLQQNIFIEDDKKYFRYLNNSEKGNSVLDEYLEYYKENDIKTLRNFVYQNFTDGDTNEFWTFMIEKIIENPDDFEDLGDGLDNIIYQLNEGQKNHEFVANKLLNVIGFTISSLLSSKEE
jgi:DNA polymerase III delta prime subunit